MFNYYNNESLRKLVVGFGNLFNDMYVAKFDKDNNIIEKDRVPLTYGPKEKFIRRIKEVSTISDNTPYKLWSIYIYQKHRREFAASRADPTHICTRVYYLYEF